MQETNETYKRRKFLEEEIIDLEKQIQPHDTGHIHTTIGTLKNQYKQATGYEYGKHPNMTTVEAPDGDKKIYESPDGGKTVYERPFGAPYTERKLVKSPFVRYGKDEHEVFITNDAFDQINAIQNEEPIEEKEEKWWVEKGMVDHPPHYNKGIETSEYIRSWEMNWDQANVIKYVTRYNLKHSQPELQCQDLRKARHYLDRLIESYEEKKD